MENTGTRITDVGANAATICHIGLPEDEAIRLRSLGIFEGQNVTIQHATSAMILGAAGGRVAVSKAVASKITVTDLRKAS